jgi:putative heme transporter
VRWGGLGLPKVTVARGILAACSILGATALLAVGLPAVAGTDWTRIAHVLTSVTAPTALGLVVLWLASLWSYTYVLTGSLPGLSNSQALVLNLAGSGVSNVLPLGGAAGVAVTFAMTRGWGHRRGAIAISTLLTGVGNILSRLLLTAVGVAVLILAGSPSGWWGIATAVTVVVLPVILIGLAAVVLCRESAMGAAARCTRLLPRRWRVTPEAVETLARRLREETREVIATGWGKMSLGLAAAALFQGVLFSSCLTATGVFPGIPLTIAAFALSRVLTTVVVTPNGFGITESATVAMLVAFGTPPAETAGAVVLFTFFTFIVEIPLGLVGFLVWTLARKWRARPQVTAVRRGRSDAGHT